MTDGIIPKYYRVTIDSTGLSGAAPANGFIDDTTIEQYGRAGAYPTSLESARTKARGNYRFRRLCEELNTVQTVTNLISIEKTAASEDSEPTEFSFTVVYDRSDYVLTRNEYSDPTNSEIEYGVSAVALAVARVFLASYTTKFEFPRDPSITNQGYEWIREDLVVATPLSGATLDNLSDALSSITVTEILFTQNN